MNVKENRTPSYVCTLDPMSTVDMEILSAIRKSISVANKDAKVVHQKWGSYKECKRVSVKGRKPIQKQLVNVGGRWGKARLAWRAHTTFGDIVGGIANAGEYDVYIHNDNRYVK